MFQSSTHHCVHICGVQGLLPPEIFSGFLLEKFAKKRLSAGEQIFFLRREGLAEVVERGCNTVSNLCGRPVGHGANRHSL